MSHRYIPINAAELPDDLRFDVPRHNQGQIVEVAFADHPTCRSEACNGSAYQRVTDRSDRSVTYYRREVQS